MQKLLLLYSAYLVSASLTDAPVISWAAVILLKFLYLANFGDKAFYVLFTEKNDGTTETIRKTEDRVPLCGITYLCGELWNHPETHSEKSYHFIIRLHW